MHPAESPHVDSPERIVRLRSLLLPAAGARTATVHLPPPGGRMEMLCYWSQLWLLLGLHAVRLRAVHLNRFLDVLQNVHSRDCWRFERLVYSIGRIDAMLGCRNGNSNDRCLLRSSLQFWSLVQTGFSPEFNIGLTTRNNAMGHAWISINGEALFEPKESASRFPVFVHRDKSVVYWIEKPSK